APAISAPAPASEPAAATQPKPPPQPAEQQHKEKQTMPKNTNGNGNGDHAGANDKTTLEKALEQIESVKGSYREAIRGLNDLTDTLKQVQRDQRTSERDVQSVRTTLEKLQGVKL